MNSLLFRITDDECFETIIEDDDDILVESSKNCDKINEDGSEIEIDDVDEVNSDHGEGESDSDSENEFGEELFEDDLPGTFQKLSKSKFTYFYKFLISFVVGNILLKIRTFIAKINRSNPLYMYVNKKKSEFSIDANFYHDFKVRWNTTYTMLTRFVTLKRVVNDMTYNASDIPNISIT